jgi:hypothetical protein
MFSVKSLSLSRQPALRLVILTLISIMTLQGCTTSLAPGVLTSPVKPLPPASQFTAPAEGTLLPPGTKYNQTLDMPAGSSGALFINKTSSPVEVAVRGTIADIPAGQIYLFVLDPGDYEFYIYGLSDVPVSQVEHLEYEKVRYLYLMPLGSQKPVTGD